MIPDSTIPPASHSQRGANFHGVAMAFGVLLLECMGCNRRQALTKAELRHIFRATCAPSPTRSSGAGSVGRRGCAATSRSVKSRSRCFSRAIRCQTSAGLCETLFTPRKLRYPRAALSPDLATSEQLLELISPRGIRVGKRNDIQVPIAEELVPVDQILESNGAIELESKERCANNQIAPTCPSLNRRGCWVKDVFSR
jgi:hypothetical protein